MRLAFRIVIPGCCRSPRDIGLSAFCARGFPRGRTGSSCSAATSPAAPLRAGPVHREPRRVRANPAAERGRLRGRPRWSPDGTQVAYTAIRGGNKDIYNRAPARASRNGSRPIRRLTTVRPGRPTGPRFVFIVEPRRHRRPVVDERRRHRGATQLTSGPASDGSPAVSPDGTRVVFTAAPAMHFRVSARHLRDGHRRL